MLSSCFCAEPLRAYTLDMTDDLTRREAADYLRCSQRTLDALLARRAIAYRRQGRRILVPRDALDAFRARTMVGAVPR